MSTIPYSQFVRDSLYGQEGQGGYYTTPQPRIGRSRTTDFFTASSVPLFPKILSAAFITLSELHKLSAPALVELANEKDNPLFPSTPTGFSSSQNFPLGTTPTFSGSNKIIFSNELFDAQPFDRFQLHEDGWHLLGIDPENQILDLDLGLLSEHPHDSKTSKASEALCNQCELEYILGAHFPIGAILDISLDALRLIDSLCKSEWKGLFIIFDYGLTLAELTDHPRPTARAYHRHRQLSLKDALTLPAASYDITVHVIWDLLADRLKALGFSVQPILTQESFFVNYAAHSFPGLNPEERQQLATLLHPAHMGASFQVLIASR